MLIHLFIIHAVHQLYARTFSLVSLKITQQILWKIDRRAFQPGKFIFANPNSFPDIFYQIKIFHLTHSIP